MLKPFIRMQISMSKMKSKRYFPPKNVRDNSDLNDFNKSIIYQRYAEEAKGKKLKTYEKAIQNQLNELGIPNLDLNIGGYSTTKRDVSENYRNEVRYVRRVMDDLSSFFKTDQIYIAGGYLRDLILDKKPHDIDVFLPHPESLDDDFIESLLYGHGRLKSVKRIKPQVDSTYNSLYGGLAVYDALYVEEKAFSQKEVYTVPVQLIFCKEIDVFQYINMYFCCNLSKIWMNSDGYIAAAPEFIKAVKDRELFFDWSWNNDMPNLKYMAKIINKFPEFHLGDYSKIKMRAALIHKAEADSQKDY